jgi:prophage regulatory protein
MAIWRIQTCKAEAGYNSSTSIYELIKDGLWSKPVRLGKRSVGWPDYEVKSICQARIAGWTPDQIRELVNHMHEERSSSIAF